jgi:aryl-alcohol dehydrogenase-like predicted oxidoreductase
MRKGRPAELVLGSVQLGLAYGSANRTGKPARETALRLIRRAADAGIEAFDTARSYGDAEERLGEGLGGDQRPPDKLRTITKLSPLEDLAPDAPPATVWEAVDRSLAQSSAALRRRSLDCVLLHRPEHRLAYGGEIWRRLKHHVGQGSIGALGVSVCRPAQALAALAEPEVRHIQLPFNLLDWRWRESGAIAGFAARPEVTIHARSVFLQGLLATGDAGCWPDIRGVRAADVIGWIDRSARRFRRESGADLALAYVRGQSWIDGVVVGQETEAQLDDNLRLCVRPVLSPEDCEALEEFAPRVPEALLDPSRWPR